MQPLAPESSVQSLQDLVPKLPQWQQLPVHEQRQLLALMQNPEAFSQLLAIQQAVSSANKGGLYNPHQSSTISNRVGDVPKTLDSERATEQRGFQAQVNTNGLGLGLAASFASNRQLPSPPQFDRSLLQSPAPAWAGPASNGEASLLAARTNALQAAQLHQEKQAAPYADFGADLFRCSSMGAAYLGNPIPAELSFRASSMPGSYQDITARLHLSRAGINTATSSMIPVISQDWLVIPFGTAQQLLPVHGGSLAQSNEEAVMLCDQRGQNWPMKCQCNREQGSFQLSEGWKAFAQCWGLGHGEQLQLSRRFVSSGCIWLDVKIVTSDPASEDAHAGPKHEQHVKPGRPTALPFWQHHLAAQAPQFQRPADHMAGMRDLSGVLPKHASQAPLAKRPIISVQRVISCPTYCSRLHVNQHMAEHLLPVLPEAQNVKPPLSYTYQSLFKHKVSVIDELGETWTVQYEGFVSAAQRHYRFTAGWTNLVKQKGIKVGDTVVLERWTEDRTKLQLHVIKGKSQDLLAASSGITKVKARRTARPAQRAKQSKQSNNFAAKQPSPQGYSPVRGTSGALEALHDAALLCASTLHSDKATYLDNEKGMRRSNSMLNDSLDGHVVSAAAVAAADAAALRFEESKSTHPAALMPRQYMPMSSAVRGPVERDNTLRDAL